MPKWFKVIDTWHKLRNEINRAEFDALLVIHPTADPNRHYQIHLLRASCCNWNYLWQNAIPLKKRSSMSLASSHVLSCTILSSSTLRHYKKPFHFSMQFAFVIHQTTKQMLLGANSNNSTLAWRTIITSRKHHDMQIYLVQQDCLRPKCTSCTSCTILSNGEEEHSLSCWGRQFQIC